MTTVKPTKPARRRKARRATTPFFVRLTRHVDEDDLMIPKGSTIWITTVLKRSYRGTWASALGSYTVTVPKSACYRVQG